MKTIDFAVLAIYAVAVFGLAQWVSRDSDKHKKTSTDYFLAGRSLLLKSRSSELQPSAVPVALGRSWLPGLVTGIAGGLASGLLGIGGAIIMIPLMVWLVRIPQHEAQATSLVFMLAPIGLPGVWVYARNGGGLPWVALGGVAVGFLFGAYAGARIAVKTRAPRLRQGFALLQMLLAALLFMKVA